MTDRAARKRRASVTMAPVEPTPRNAAESEGEPRAGDPTAGLKSGAAIEAFHMGPFEALAPQFTAEGLLAGMVADGAAADGPGDSAPYQLPDGTWEVLTLDADGRVTARRTVEGPK